MSSLVRSTGLLFRYQLAGIVRSKRTLVCVLLAAVPIVIALLMTHFIDDVAEAPAGLLGWMLQVQVILPLLALVLGSGAVSTEVEERTLSYLFSRPIPRATVLLGRWAASLVVLCAILIAMNTLMIGVFSTGLPAGRAVPVPDGLWASLSLTLVVGATVYSGLFASIGTFVKFPMIVGLGYVFAIEELLGTLPGRSQVLSMQFHLRSFTLETSPEVWERTANIVFREAGGPPGEGGLRTLLIVLVVALLIGVRIVSRKQYVLSA